MRLLTYSTVFLPSIGGMQNRLRVLATEFVRQGIDVTVVTETPGNGNDSFPFPVVRRPSLRAFCSLLREADLLHQNNLTLRCLHPLVLVPRPLVVSHHSEYVRNSDRRGFRDLLKLGVARFTVNIACSRSIARQFPHCSVVLNPYDDTIFTNHGWKRDRDLIFVGRLVSQKGCDTLIEALSLLRRSGLRPSCMIVGGGPERHRLQAMATEHGVSGQVEFAGPLEPVSVADMLNQHRIIVVPSRCREGFGIVALEGLACGCLPVVSRQGGLVEATGGYGTTFVNGSAQDLARALAETLRDWRAARAKLDGAEAHLAARTPQAVARGYIEVFRTTLSGRP
jgi:glycogen synthase